MKKYEQGGIDLRNVVNEDMPAYETREALEDARLREAINRTDTEKFHFLMILMKMNNHMRKAVIHHKKGY